MPFIEKIEAILESIGRASAWILLVLLASIVLQVGLNAISSSITWMEELQWYLYGISSMVALSYTMTGNGHVRVDVLHRRFGVRTKQILEMVWIIIALIPLYIVTLVYGWNFAIESFSIMEGSPDPGGMPYRWIVKAFIPLASVLLMVTAILRAILIWSKPELLEETEIIHGD
ncbi:MAG: TRAP transporter small permease subunit [Opitutales bacterium]|jgi:TRAP-type mannitol/chloroaromatic compound transport system permease small subunit|nr:TRAP transporter small permease subunit [Opitutales bacterium]MDB2499596.1 TRAP transporter small permease subunit [bacterium]MDG2168867.1 TRAP transporter small permease subunit [Opitutales bacterium]